jgi:hypothetical protein
MRSTVFCCALVATCLIAGVSNAAPTFDLQVFSTNPTGSYPGVSINFENLTTSNTPITTQYASQGVTFSANTGGLFSGNQADGFSQFANGGAVIATNQDPHNFSGNPVSLTLSSPLTQIAFDISGWLINQVTVKTFFQGTQTGAITLPNTNDLVLGTPDSVGNFLGITDPSGIDSLQISASISGRFILDDIRLGPSLVTPEPTSLAIWSVLGLGGVYWQRRRRAVLSTAEITA